MKLESDPQELPVRASPPFTVSSAGDSVGKRLRRRRKAKRLTLKDVSTQTGLAEGFISQLERGVHSGSVRTLQKLCAVLGLSVGDLFEESGPGPSKVRHFVDGQGFTFGVNARKARLTPTSFDNLEVFLGDLGPYGSTGVEPYAHGDSEELVMVLEGTVDVTLGHETYRLKSLDALPYTSDVLHRVVEAVGQPAKVLWAIAPPSY